MATTLDLPRSGARRKPVVEEREREYGTAGVPSLPSVGPAPTSGGLIESDRAERGPARPQLARELYRYQAPFYSGQKLVFTPYRRRVVDLLELATGASVLDVGCGTGLCFPFIEERIGPTGRLVGLDLCPEMLEQAKEQARAEGWRNVTLVTGDIADTGIRGNFDAVLFSFTHDLLQSPAAVENVFRHLRDGAHVASVGPVWAPWWAPGLSILLALELAPYVTTFDGLDRPWRYLERFVPDLRVDRGIPPVFYFASGRAAWPAKS
jgi:SAM-dependent methyltransferase